MLTSRGCPDYSWTTQIESDSGHCADLAWDIVVEGILTVRIYNNIPVDLQFMKFVSASTTKSLPDVVA